MSETTARTGKELILASKPFAQEVRWKSWYYTVQTLLFLAACITVAIVAPWWYVRVLFSMVSGLLIVRGFILYHDHLHGALLYKSPLAKKIFTVYGLLLMTPRRVWKETHNYHHAHTAKLAGSHIGSYMMATTRMWRRMNKKQRLFYKVARHPLTILFGFFTIFIGGMCISAFKRNPKKNWDSALALMVHLTGAALVIYFAGFYVYFFGWFLPLFIATAVGAYLFYAQHNFPEIDVKSRADWEYTHAALESSSFMEMSPIMHWFTGNIGYHHVHHLNPSIPFYRLPEAMEAIPELQNPGKTSLRPSAIVNCFRLKLWDPRSKQMVGYPD